MLEGVEDDRREASEDAVDHEGRRVLDEHGALAELLGEGPRRRKRGLVGLVGAHELDERQERDGVEEVDADVRAHLGDREAGGVGGEDGLGLHVLSKLGEDLLLELELLEDGLEHEVAVGEVLVAGGRRD